MSAEIEITDQITPLLRQLNDALISLRKKDGTSRPDHVNNLIDGCVLNLSTLTTLKNTPTTLLLTIKDILRSNDTELGINYSSLLELLDNLVTLCPFDSIIEVYPPAELLEAVNSGITPLIRSACKVVSKSNPPDRLLEEEQTVDSFGIFQTLLRLYFDKNSDIEVVNDIEKLFHELCGNVNVYNFFTDRSLPFLLKVKDELDSVRVTRLLELLSILFDPRAPAAQFNERLFFFDSNELKKSIEVDVFLFVGLLRYYAHIIKVISASSKEVMITHNIAAGPADFSWLLTKLRPIIFAIGDIFCSDTDGVRSFASSYFFEIFRAFSHLYDLDTIYQFDLEYLHINRENRDLDDLLALLNPEYLCSYHAELVSSYVSLSPSHLAIFRNLISNETSFNAIKNKITSHNVLNMPYLEQMVLMEKLSQYEYSANFLIHDLPKVMSNLIDDGGNTSIVEPEVVELRRTTIKNLLQYDPTFLNVWYAPLAEELDRYNSGKSNREAKASVADIFL